MIISPKQASQVLVTAVAAGLATNYALKGKFYDWLNPPKAPTTPSDPSHVSKTPKSTISKAWSTEISVCVALAAGLLVACYNGSIPVSAIASRFTSSKSSPSTVTEAVAIKELAPQPINPPVVTKVIESPEKSLEALNQRALKGDNSARMQLYFQFVELPKIQAWFEGYKETLSNNIPKE